VKWKVRDHEGCSHMEVTRFALWPKKLQIDGVDHKVWLEPYTLCLRIPSHVKPSGFALNDHDSCYLRPHWGFKVKYFTKIKPYFDVYVDSDGVEYRLLGGRMVEEPTQPIEVIETAEDLLDKMDYSLSKLEKKILNFEKSYPKPKKKQYAVNKYGDQYVSGYDYNYDDDDGGFDAPNYSKPADKAYDNIDTIL
jgi:hypothetical protein